MEVLFFLAIGFLALLFIGSKDNSRPVSEWSNEKLMRMHRKLIDAGQIEKANEVAKECKKREIDAGKRKALVEIETDKPVNPIKLSPDLSIKMVELIKKTMLENNCNHTKAHEVIAFKIAFLKHEFLKNGFSPEASEERAIKSILSEPENAFVTKDITVIISDRVKDLDWEELGMFLVELSLNNLAQDHDFISKHCNDFKKASATSISQYELLSISYYIALHLYAFLYMKGYMRAPLFDKVINGIVESILSMKIDKGRGGNLWKPEAIKIFHSYIHKYLDLSLKLETSSTQEGCVSFNTVGMAITEDMFKAYNIDTVDNAVFKFAICHYFDATRMTLLKFYAENSKIIPLKHYAEP